MRKALFGASVLLLATLAADGGATQAFPSLDADRIVQRSSRAPSFALAPTRDVRARITAFRAVPQRIRRGRRLPRLVHGLRRPGFQFRITEAAEVVLNFHRCLSRRGCGHWRVERSVTFDALKGANTIRFRGRLEGSGLRKGRYRATLTVPEGRSAWVLFSLV